MLLSSRSSWSEIRSFSNSIQRFKRPLLSSPSSISSPIIADGGQINLPILLVGNKSDLIDKRTVSEQEGRELACELGCKFLEASAKDCINVEQAFSNIVQEIRQHDVAPSCSSPWGSHNCAAADYGGWWWGGKKCPIF